MYCKLYVYDQIHLEIKKKRLIIFNEKIIYSIIYVSVHEYNFNWSGSYGFYDPLFSNIQRGFKKAYYIVRKDDILMTIYHFKNESLEERNKTIIINLNVLFSYIAYHFNQKVFIKELWVDNQKILNEHYILNQNLVKYTNCETTSIKIKYLEEGNYLYKLSTVVGPDLHDFFIKKN